MLNSDLALDISHYNTLLSVNLDNEEDNDELATDLPEEDRTRRRSAVVHCSYLQIYNDNVYDLLQDRRFQKPLHVRGLGAGGARSWGPCAVLSA